MNERDELVAAVALALSDESWQEPGIEIPLPDLLADSILYHRGEAKQETLPTRLSVPAGTSLSDTHYRQALDVDRLAQAITVVSFPDVLGGLGSERPTPALARRWADVIAAEYIRLTEAGQ